MKNANFEQIQNQLLDNLQDADCQITTGSKLMPAINKIAETLSIYLPNPDEDLLFPYPAENWPLDSCHDAEAICILLDESGQELENDEPIQNIIQKLNFIQADDISGGNLWVKSNQINDTLMLISISYQY